MLKGEQRRLQRYAIKSIPARVYEGIHTWFTILALSATSCSPARQRRAVLVCGGRELALGRRIPKQDGRPSGRWAATSCQVPPGGHRDSGGPPARRNLARAAATGNKPRPPQWTVSPHADRSRPAPRQQGRERIGRYGLCCGRIRKLPDDRRSSTFHREGFQP